MRHRDHARQQQRVDREGAPASGRGGHHDQDEGDDGDELHLGRQPVDHGVADDEQPLLGRAQADVAVRVTGEVAAREGARALAGAP
ncbi:hypothetical protein GCM10025862_31180 [Arsenicicoccus piscis]|uniref:Uncharacterized protein n=1 Tax=Arsenicicoccus piscis TaxID=673954 RepID=A0ABQ6HSE6_9MICO|nr:hypothetical protein GCM10025862_31180 [Arsenicicoccus piscis]